jgi:hypothetical protein
MFAGQTRIPQFRSRSLTGMGLGRRRSSHWRRTARPGRLPLDRGSGGRPECPRGNEFEDGTSSGGAEGDWRNRRIGLSPDDQRPRCRAGCIGAGRSGG